jgi:hypothetical protein
MSESVSLRLFTTAVQVRVLASKRGIHVAKNGTGTGFLRVYQLPAVSIIQQVLLLLTEGQTGEVWEHSNRRGFLSDIGEYQELKVRTFVCLRPPGVRDF